jgi:hypothetical protein
VTPGKPFTLNLWYTQTHPRESDIIAVALHADTKEYFGGFTIPINQVLHHSTKAQPSLHKNTALSSPLLRLT